MAKGLHTINRLNQFSVNEKLLEIGGIIEVIEKFVVEQDKIILINCHCNVSSKGLRNLVTFVEKGGFLFTTDWALRHVIEPGFPGYIKYNNRPTSDEVVRVDILAEEDPFLPKRIGHRWRNPCRL